MITRGTIEEILEYRDSDAVSQSFLKDVVMRGKPARTKHKESVTGDIVDMYLTLPNEVEDFYTTYSGGVPSPRLTEILTATMEWLYGKGSLTPNIRDHRGAILKIAADDQFDMNKSDAVKFKQIEEKAKEWWEFMVTAGGKNVVSEKDRSFGAEIARYAENHPVSGPWFHDVPDRDFYFQVPTYFYHNGVECKILPDISVVSHLKKKLIIVDIKTVFASDHSTIAHQIKKYDYPNQLSYYGVGMETQLEALGAVGYAIETYWLFIPKDIRDEGKYFTPVLWPCTEEMKHWARFGGLYKSGNEYISGNHYMESKKHIMGWEQALEIYRNAKEKNLSSYSVQANKTITPNDANQLFFT